MYQHKLTLYRASAFAPSLVLAEVVEVYRLSLLSGESSLYSLYSCGVNKLVAVIPQLRTFNLQHIWHTVMEQ